MSLRIDACLARHQGDRLEQQDRVDLVVHPDQPGLVLAVLGDGMGGHSGGGLAADQLVVRARQNFAAYHPSGESPRAFLEGVVQDAHVMVTLSGYTSEQNPHTTAVLLLLQGPSAWWAHCGDSRLYRFRGAAPLGHTQDHSLVEGLVREGRISAGEAENHPQRHILLSCLGGKVLPQVEHGHAAVLVAGDAFLLCSDGLWAHFSDQELGDLIASHRARESAGILVDLARQRARGGGDNISLALVKVVET
ncbi:MAG: serine/threonine-protein phosphatase [Zoogloeaceae bacterium]|nr:serine/threonine-protein phosphatase [Zoogloeaceae bacterium]